MENDFLIDSLMLYTERDLALVFSLDSIIDDFEDLKERQIPFFIDNVLRNNSVLCLLFLLVDECILIYYDLGACKQIWEYHVNQHYEIRRDYIKNGSHQPHLEKYNQSGKHNRNFQVS